MKLLFGNAQHIGSRESQQDAFGFTSPFDAEFVRHAGLAAVLADGMGGMRSGDAASRAAIGAFLAAYKGKTPDESIPDALLRSLLAANQAVCQVGEESGSTLAAAVLHERELYWISVGDSAVYLHRDGDLTLLTTSHVYARELDARASEGAIAESAARSDPQREALTSYLGMPALDLIDRSLRPMAVEAPDHILIASDGLFKTLEPDEMRQASKGAPQQVCDVLVERALAKGREGQDNITVLALALREEVEIPALVTMRNKRRAPLRYRLGVTALLAVLAAAAALYRGSVKAPKEPGEQMATAPQQRDASKVTTPDIQLEEKK
jgi:serine/threonine protein phosphatase PrpC